MIIQEDWDANHPQSFRMNMRCGVRRPSTYRYVALETKSLLCAIWDGRMIRRPSSLKKPTPMELFGNGLIEFIKRKKSLRLGRKSTENNMRSDSFRDFVMEQLFGLKPVECRSMFGGFGLYKDRRFFGIIDKGRLYFKVSDKTQPLYSEAGSLPFNPFKKTILKSFFEVPVDVIENQHQLVEWARSAVDAVSETKIVTRKKISGIKPDHILSGHTPKIKSLSNILRDLIKETIPEATEHAYPGWHAIGYRHPKAGYFCGVFPFDDTVKLYFEHGAKLVDPHRILEGIQKQIRFIQFKSENNIRTKPLKSLLLAAVRLKTFQPV